MLRYIVFGFVVLAGVHVDSKYSDQDKEAMRALLKPVVTSCLDKFGLDPAVFESEKKEDSVDPCVKACILRGSGALDANGMYDKAGALAFVKKAVTNEDTLKETSESQNICEKVNKEDVSDGAEGCERAALIVKCFKELQFEVVQ